MVNPETYSFILLILGFIRFMGGLIFLEFYIKYKTNRFLLLTLAFTLFALNPLIQIFLPSIDEMVSVDDPFIYDKIIFIFSELLLAVAVLLFVGIILLYSRRFNTKYLFYGSILIVVIVTLLYPFLSFIELFYLIQIIDLLLIISVVPTVIYYRENLMRIAENIPFFVTLNIVIIVINLLTTFVDVLSFIEILTRIGYTFVTPFTLLHLEYHLVALEKYELKDKYSHNLAQLLQLSSGRIYMMCKNREIDSVVEQGLNDLQDDLDQINDLIVKIRKI